ncbi:hypothetical protein BVX94_03150 [bacterium B17]|nr:hypothetical protein BVX94_03150 [bacterium B17]
MSPDAADQLEAMAERSSRLTRHHFGNTMSLYTPLYLSNYCSGGCSYCGFASDRSYKRHRLEKDELCSELEALKQKGIQDILLLTGERTDAADFDYLLEMVRISAEHIHNVSVEAFAMTEAEYAELINAGCTGVTLYQETYVPERYADLHRWGEKTDYEYRVMAAERALSAGMRTFGMGVLLGLSDPLEDMMYLFRHIRYVQKKFWKTGVQVSFPRICKQEGGYEPEFEITDRMLAQYIFAFRICLPDAHLVLSTRESCSFRDGMAGMGNSRMRVGSRKSAGGDQGETQDPAKKFYGKDARAVLEYFKMWKNQTPHQALMNRGNRAQ